MGEVRVSGRRRHEEHIAAVIDSAGLRVSQTIGSDSLRLEPFGDGWIAAFDGFVFLTREQMTALAEAMPETHVSGMGDER